MLAILVRSSTVLLTGLDALEAPTAVLPMATDAACRDAHDPLLIFGLGTFVEPKPGLANGGGRLDKGGRDPEGAKPEIAGRLRFPEGGREADWEAAEPGRESVPTPSSLCFPDPGRRLGEDARAFGLGGAGALLSSLGPSP